MMRIKFCLFILFVFSTVTTSVFAQNDMAGSSDHPDIKRIAGSIIWGYQNTDYDEAMFLLSREGKLQNNTVGGKRTQILYFAPGKVTLPAVFKNYDTALGELGTSELIYRCSTDCAANFSDGFIWKEDNRIPTALKGTQYLYMRGNAPSFADQGYSYWVVTTESARYHVSVYSAFFTGKGIFRMEPDVANTRSVHVDILEEADFEATLDHITADQISEELAQNGRIALYGIYFDFDSDTLKEDSKPALEAISSALNSDPSLKIYVVGHTDNQGSHDYNMGLSERRAASVVEALNNHHGIADNRLQAVGVGPVSPVASNRNEGGQALNRRVELVEKW